MTNLGIRMGRPIRAAAKLAALMMITGSGAASAQIVETSTIVNRYSYGLGTQFGTGGVEGSNIFGSGDDSVFRSFNGETGLSEMGISITSFLDDGSFSFLQNGFCIGDCTMDLVTDITFTLFNSGTEAVDLRFDSLITPGHLARTRFNGPGDAGAIYRFDVTENPDTGANVLFDSFGNAFRDTLTVVNSDNSVFNGFNLQVNPPDFSVLDWSATNLNLQLSTLAPGETRIVRYHSELYVGSLRSGCTDLAQCTGFQVAFGDPRNKGGTMNIEGFGSFNDPLLPAVGAIYDPFRINYNFVPVGSPLPDTPDVIAPIPYNTGYVPLDMGAVPEPATWAFMIFGFGAIGGAMRSRRKQSLAVSYA